MKESTATIEKEKQVNVSMKSRATQIFDKRIKEESESVQEVLLNSSQINSIFEDITTWEKRMKQMKTVLPQLQAAALESRVKQDLDRRLQSKKGRPEIPGEQAELTDYKQDCKEIEERANLALSNLPQLLDLLIEEANEAAGLGKISTSYIRALSGVGNHLRAALNGLLKANELQRDFQNIAVGIENILTDRSALYKPELLQIANFEQFRKAVGQFGREVSSEELRISSGDMTEEEQEIQEINNENDSWMKVHEEHLDQFLETKIGQQMREYVKLAIEFYDTCLHQYTHDSPTVVNAKIQANAKFKKLHDVVCEKYREDKRSFLYGSVI